MKRYGMALLACCSLLTSCAVPGQQGNQAGAIGAGAGALAGAILGQAIGRNTAGTLIGAAAGGALGYAIGSQVNMKSTKVYNEQQTQKMVTATARETKVLEIHSQSVEPRTVHPGDTVTVKVAYMVIDKQLTTVSVRETKTLWFKGQQQSVFDDTVVARDNGTWESYIQFQIPPSAQKGSYTVCHDIAMGSITRSTKTDFVVM